MSVNPTSIVLILATLTLLVVLLSGWGRRRRQVHAALLAQSARDSDELDLDKRLGPKQTLEIETIGGEKIKIAVRQTGHGPDILCLHGIGASMIIYRRLVPWLSGDHRVTCIDFPGFGFSDKPKSLDYTLDEQARHLSRIIQGLNLDRPLAIASSMGGAIALKTAIDHPQLFRSLVVLAAATDPRRIPTLLLPLVKYGDRLHRINSSAAVRAVLAQVVARRELITPALIALYQAPFKDQGASSSAFLKAFHLLSDKRMPALFKDVEIPVLIVRGLRDRLVKQSACEDLRSLIRHAQLITHASAGHHIMEDEPEFVARAVRDFAERAVRDFAERAGRDFDSQNTQ